MQKEHYDIPSDVARMSMIKQGFKIGQPVVPGWFMVVVRSESNSEFYLVLQLWYNPESPDKWYTGGGYVSSNAEPYKLASNIRAYKLMPHIQTVKDVCILT